MSRTRVLIIDQHYFARKGINDFLAKEPGVQVIGAVADEEEGVRQALQSKPEVVIYDLSAQVDPSLSAILTLKTRLPETRVILLTNCENMTAIWESIHSAGIDGCLLADTNELMLLQAINAVRKGDIPLHPRLTRYLFAAFKAEQNDQGPVLTPREQEVLHLLVGGSSNKAIAATLSLARGTVKIHISNILHKLKATNRTEAAVRAVQLGLIQKEGSTS